MLKNEFSLDNFNLSLVKRLPISYWRENGCLIYEEKEEKFVFFIDGSENSYLAVRELILKWGKQAEVQEMNSDALQALIAEVYEKATSLTDVIDELEEDNDLQKITTDLIKDVDLLSSEEETPIIKLLNTILLQAVKDRASDIHIEPYETNINVRMRIDGSLQEVLTLPLSFKDSLLSRLKIMADLDIAEKRLAQDGRIKIVVGNKKVDIRLSVIPTAYGERAVLRMLDKKGGILQLEKIGLNGRELQKLESILTQPNGIILVTGPTGSGKTTTLYAFLNRIVDSTRNIITVEDPIEYQIPGIAQMQVNPGIGMTFAAGLRSILRQDPDVIMVGEIRDFETAQIAIQASLTGHLVFSTLHTNDAPSGITRLLDMEIEPFLLASSVRTILAQRLVRTICEGCKSKYPVTDEEKMYLPEMDINYLFKGSGCPKCRNTGYKGRTAIFEILYITESIRKLIIQKQDSSLIKNMARREGMLTLRENGFLKVKSGVTTLEELLKVTGKNASV
jgi:general secretion pathway protein E